MPTNVSGAKRRPSREKLRENLAGSVAYHQITVNVACHRLELLVHQNACGRVFVTLYELGLEFELVTVSFVTGEQKASEYVEKQPFAQIPLLEDGDVRVFESRAIMRYLADRYGGGERSLYGNTVVERALVNQWMEVESQNYSEPVMKLLSQTEKYRKLRPETLVEPVEKFKEKFRQVLEIYDARLASSKYLAGDALSLADLAHVTPTQYLLVSSAETAELFQSYKHVFAWWADISSRPSCQRALAEAAPLIPE